MSRSLVGSSRSSTLGSERSSLSSWNRRRSPPERSPSRAVSRSPVNPNRSSIELAETSLPAAQPGDPADVLDARQHPGVRVLDGHVLGEVLEGDRPAALDPTRVRRAASPATSDEHGGLAGAVDPDDADAVARSEPPGRVLEQPLACPAYEVDVLEVDDVLAEPLGGEPLQRQPVAWRAVRRRSARWPRRCGTSASRCEPAGRDAARRAPCASGSAGAARWPRPDASARPWRARRRRTHPRRSRPLRRRRPGCTSQVRSQTASRNQRSWVTTTSADVRRTRWSASQATASTSRWLVGSSRISRSSSFSSNRASEHRRRSPPERPCTTRSSATPASSTSTTSRVRESAAHSCSSRPSRTTSRTVCSSSSRSRWSR